MIARLDRLIGWPLLLVLLLLAPWPAAGQGTGQGAPSPAAAPPEITAQDLDQLAAVLNDPAQRARLLTALQALAASRQAPAATPAPAAPAAPPAAAAPVVEPRGLGATLVAAIGDELRQLGNGVATAVGTVNQLPEIAEDVARQAQSPAIRAIWLEVAIKLAVVLLAATLAYLLAQRLLRRPRRALECRAAESLWVRLPLVLLRAVVDLVPTAAFAITAYLVLPATAPRPLVRLVAVALINAVIMVRAIAAVSYALLVPHPGGGRLLPLGEETATYLYIWVRRLTATIFYGGFLLQAADLLGLPPAVYELLLRLLGLLVAGLLVVLVLQNRAAVAGWLRGHADDGAVGRLRGRLAEIWHVLAFLYILVVYAIWVIDLDSGFGYLLRATLLTGLVLALRWVAELAVRRVVSRGFAMTREMKLRYPYLEARANRYLPLLEAVLIGLLYLLALLAVLDVWGLDAFGWLTGTLGRRLTSSVANIVLVLVLAAAALETVTFLTERYLRRTDGSGRGLPRNARSRTLLPLIRTAFRIVLLVIVALIVLSELGIDIAPLLAGAGVVGLAIGFGAQTLVKDVITGFFILAEDTIAVGDVIDLDGKSGVVEAMTIRTIRLRDVAGAVYTVPFSAVTSVKNLTKAFAYAVFDVTLTYRDDLQRAAEAMKQVGSAMQAEEEFKLDIRAPVEVMGVETFRDIGVVFRARMMTAPGAQWRVSRAFLGRLKEAFLAGGIEYPVPAHIYGTPPAPPAAPAG
jgi:small conductance mechanosensitive channel